MTRHRPAGRSAALALLGSGLAHGALNRWVTGARWQRTNHAGAPVTLLEGPAYVVGAAIGAATGDLAGAVAVLGSGAFGALDDLAGDGSSKGLKGHLGAAARGRVTTGLVKVVGIGATGLLAAVLTDRDREDLDAIDTLVGGALVAATANLANLLDLRPGRALKATLLAGGAILVASDSRGQVSAGAAIGAAVGVLPADLAGRSMLGDTGANAAGALIGTALLESTGRRARVLALLALTALTLVSERVSFTEVIESTPVLRELDAWGRPPR